MADIICLKQHQGRLGFGDLPMVARATIYRMLFKQAASVDIGSHRATNLSRSAHFLRVCRLINREGADVLYKETLFLFRRNFTKSLMNTGPVEVGYQPFLYFLRTIGTHNVSRLRDIGIVLTDGHGPLDINERHRSLWFGDTAELIEALEFLGGYGDLRRLKLEITGGHEEGYGLQPQHGVFLAVLTQIKVDNLAIGHLDEDFETSPWLIEKYLIRKYFYRQNYPDGGMYIASGLDRQLAGEMIRGTEEPKYGKFVETHVGIGTLYLYVPVLEEPGVSGGQETKVESPVSVFWFYGRRFLTDCASDGEAYTITIPMGIVIVTGVYRREVLVEGGLQRGSCVTASGELFIAWERFTVGDNHLKRGIPLGFTTRFLQFETAYSG